MKSASLRPIQIGFRVTAALIALALIGALTAIHLKFTNFLIGNIRTDSSAQILTKINSVNLDSAEKRFRNRLQSPYAPTDLHNPFNPLPLPTPPNPSP